MKITLLSLLLVWASSIFASEALTTDSMVQVFEKLEEKVATYGRENVLLVFDIDNTLLTATTDIGSDQWFTWQEKIMKNPNCKPECVTTDFNQLLEIQAKLSSLSKLRLTDAALPELVKKVQLAGQKIVLLTSRGHEMRSSTEYNLKLNGMDFYPSTLNSALDVTTTYIPYGTENGFLAGLSEDDRRRAVLQEALPVSFQNGIYMTSGQHKGVMLKALLNKYQSNFKAIVYADDLKKHVERVQAILGQTMDVTTFRYSKIDPEVEKFNASDKAEVTKKWLKLEEALQEAGL